VKTESTPTQFRDLLDSRQSVREYSNKKLTKQQVHALLWAAQGTTSPHGGRTAPSAGAVYPLEVFVALPDGLFRYDTKSDEVRMHKEEDIRMDLYEAGLRQDAIKNAPAVFVFTGVVERTARKYGDRSEQYVLLEVGHAAQNLLLQVVEFGLGAVPIGAYDDEAVREALDLPEDFSVYYLIPVGHPL